MSEHDTRDAAAWEGVSAAFAALGRAFLCADSSFRVLHASIVLDDVLSSGASAAAAGRTLEEMLGPELFGPSGALRRSLGRAAPVARGAQGAARLRLAGQREAGLE